MFESTYLHRMNRQKGYLYTYLFHAILYNYQFNLYNQDNTLNRNVRGSLIVATMKNCLQNSFLGTSRVIDKVGLLIFFINILLKQLHSGKLGHGPETV